MASGRSLLKTTAARILVVGYPGAGKSGSLAALANAGLKLRVLAFDKLANAQAFLSYVKPEFLDNIDIVAFEDELGIKGPTGTLEPTKTPSAFADALKLLSRWEYTAEDGTKVDLGYSGDWGPDTVVVLDSLTSHGDAALRRARSLMNKTLRDTTDGTYGLAMAEQDNFIETLVGNKHRHHVIVLSHLKIVGPRENRKGDDDVTKQIKAAVADLVPSRLYPSALGKDLAQKIARHFPTTVLAEQYELPGNRVGRRFRTLPRVDMDLKVPAPDVSALDKSDISDGLLKIFNAITPGVEALLAQAREEVATKSEGDKK